MDLDSHPEFIKNLRKCLQNDERTETSNVWIEGLMTYISTPTNKDDEDNRFFYEVEKQEDFERVRDFFRLVTTLLLLCCV